MSSLYEILEVSCNASPEVIKAAYKALMHKYHPDKNPTNGAMTDRCSEINRAYDTLSDKDKKRQYDLSMRQSPSPQRQGPSAYSQPQQKAPEPPPAKQYTYDSKWEKFLADRPTWAKMTPPMSSWDNPDVPVRKLPGGFMDVRPDLEMWAQWIIRAGQQNKISYDKIRDEIVKTLDYFCEGHGSLSCALNREVTEEWINKARGYHQTKVQFGV